ncbi:LAETG motif-containing sortase-dependent surface protein [Streptomyces sp. ID01-9D]|uniref:LAETG motif-containing sortase-dependent surface protein n=1 Tax=Streptomyces sp. ID01-9D TaxID=3028659 RepID=UPI0029C39F99|nr:LAETG motif-containing sortase-dependent surface protein [Streptomyces sp. ID01-9D]MDX5573706.1 LAETG motif-containing sortase-dependent surface protein [Streptomyces sp. ID01-9D]
MRITPSRRRTLRGSTAAIAATALVALGAAPALADEPEPDLGVGTIAPIKGVQAGSAFSTPLTFLNKGTEEVPVSYVTYAVSPGLQADETYKNCSYYTIPSHDEIPDEQVAACKIDQPLKPGVVYGTEKPLSLKALDSALNDDLRVTIGVTEPDPDSGDTGADEPVPGTGDPLTLVEKGPATDADRANHPESAASADVTAANTADFALTGAELKGEVGDKVTATVKFANKGPARVQGTIDQSVTTVDVRIPKGTSVVKAHGYCDAVTETHYRCGTSQSWVDVNGGESYDFVLRIDKAVGRTTGEVSFGGPERPFDRNAANDTAQIVIDTGKGSDTSGSSGSSGATGGTGGSSSTGGSDTTGGTSGTGGSGSSGGSAGTGGPTTGGATPQTGGNLAATGSDSTAPLAGMAAAAVAAGGGIVWAVRRRSAARGN